MSGEHTRGWDQLRSAQGSVHNKAYSCRGILVVCRGEGAIRIRVREMT